MTICLTCGETIPTNPITGWSEGNNPWPINADPSLEYRRVCDDCNAFYVIPARLGRAVEGTLYNTDGSVLGTFGSIEPEPGGRRSRTRTEVDA